MEKKINSTVVYDGRVIKVTSDDVLTKSGKTASRDVVHHTGGAGIIPVDDEKNVYLIRQFRYAVGKEMIEIPAGKIDKGEDPKTAAVRELREEAGIDAKNSFWLADMIPTCGYCNEVIYIYYATGLSFSEKSLDDDEYTEVFKVSLEKAVDMVMSGEINDAKTSFAILALEQTLRRENA